MLWNLVCVDCLAWKYKKRVDFSPWCWDTFQRCCPLMFYWFTSNWLLIISCIWMYNLLMACIAELNAWFIYILYIRWCIFEFHLDTVESLKKVVDCSYCAWFDAFFIYLACKRSFDFIMARYEVCMPAFSQFACLSIGFKDICCHRSNSSIGRGISSAVLEQNPID